MFPTLFLRVRNLVFVALHLREFYKLRKFVLQEFKTNDLSLNAISTKLLPYVPYKYGTYVELGAYNGISQSNSLLFQIDLFWRGILIEPVPKYYSELLFYRGKINKCANYAAVSANSIKKATVANSGLMSAITDIQGSISNIEEHLSIGLKFLPSTHKIERIEVKTKTLDEILTEVSAPKRIDILFLDVEGQELAVLKGMVNSKFIIKYICVEARNIDEIRDFLRESYILVARLTLHDYLLQRKDNLSFLNS